MYFLILTNLLQKPQTTKPNYWKTMLVIFSELQVSF